MQRYNILIGCDQKYYDDWGVHLLKSIYDRNKWLEHRLHCHIVNPTKFDSLPYVNYTTEYRNFESQESKISYLQAVRFLKVAEKIDSNNLFLTLDADTICTRSFIEKDFAMLFDQINVLLHRKSLHWLAGFITFNSVDFAQNYSKMLLELPIDNWSYGRDQVVLAKLSKQYEFNSIGHKWMYYGKNTKGSVFYTLKGTQKIKNNYLDVYKRYIT